MTEESKAGGERGGESLPCPHCGGWGVVGVEEDDHPAPSGWRRAAEGWWVRGFCGVCGGEGTLPVADLSQFRGGEAAATPAPCSRCEVLSRALEDRERELAELREGR